MAIVNKVDFKKQVTIKDTIAYQILSYCFFNGVHISSTDLKLLTELAKQSGIELTKFCIYLTDNNIFKTSTISVSIPRYPRSFSSFCKNGSSIVP